MSHTARKEILVIGGTGAQGIPVVKGEWVTEPETATGTPPPLILVGPVL